MSNSKKAKYHKSIPGAWDSLAILDALPAAGMQHGDLRQRWPETEKALQKEHEILITRDSKPVAKLVL